MLDLNAHSIANDIKGNYKEAFDQSPLSTELIFFRNFEPDDEADFGNMW